MKISKLKVGEVFKNYRVLCEELGMEIKASTNSKNGQLKELSRFCKFKKDGYKFTIKQVYDNPLPKVENRGKSKGSRNNNNIYGAMIELLILDLLAQCKNGFLSISRSKLMLAINMVNVNYGFCGENVPKMAKYIEMKEEIIYDFYNTSNSNFKNTIEASLKRLRDRRIISYNVITKVSDTGTRLNRSATIEEEKRITVHEKSILNELGYRGMPQVRISRHWKLFKRKVKKLIDSDNTMSINYYYSAYDIIINEVHLQEERKEILDLLLEKVKRDEYKGELNATVYYNLLNNAIRRHERGFTSRKMSKYRLKDNYVNDIKKLIGLVVDDATGDIVYSVMNIEDDNTLSKEDLELIESLF